MRKALGVVGFTILVAAGAEVGATASTASIGDGSARASASAERTGNRFATDPNGCGFRAGLSLDSLDDRAPELVLHRFDGDVTDDTRFELPDQVDTSHRVVQSHDCTTALIYEGSRSSDRYVLVDLQSGTSRIGRLGAPGGQFRNQIAALPDGRFVDWIDVGNNGIAVVDAFTQERIDMWTLRTVPGQPGAFSDDGDVFAWFRRDSPGDPDDPFRLRFFRSGEPRPFATAEVPVFPGQTFRVDLSPTSEYAIVEGPLPGVFLSKVIDQAGNTIVDFTDTERSLRATFVDDETIVLCRFEGAYRADLDGNEELIESFPAPIAVPRSGDGDSVLFSVENSACVEALSSPGSGRSFFQRGI